MDVLRDRWKCERWEPGVPIKFYFNWWKEKGKATLLRKRVHGLFILSRGFFSERATVASLLFTFPKAGTFQVFVQTKVTSILHCKVWFYTWIQFFHNKETTKPYLEFKTPFFKEIYIVVMHTPQVILINNIRTK